MFLLLWALLVTDPMENKKLSQLENIDKYHFFEADSKTSQQKFEITMEVTIRVVDDKKYEECGREVQKRTINEKWNAESSPDSCRNVSDGVQSKHSTRNIKTTVLNLSENCSPNARRFKVKILQWKHDETLGKWTCRVEGTSTADGLERLLQLTKKQWSNEAKTGTKVEFNQVKIQCEYDFDEFCIILNDQHVHQYQR